jgi:hypothetical protein
MPGTRNGGRPGFGDLGAVSAPFVSMTVVNRLRAGLPRRIACLGRTRVKMVTAGVTAAGTRMLSGLITERRESHRGDKTDKQNNRRRPCRVDGNDANQTAAHHRPTTAGVCLRIHSANRRSYRVQRVVGTTRARSQLPCRRPARHLTVQRCAGMGSGDTPRPQPRRRRPDIGVMPIRTLLHGRARIGLRGQVRRNHVEPAHRAIFLRRRARFRVMPDRQLLHGRRHARLIHLSVQRRHVEFCS